MESHIDHIEYPKSLKHKSEDILHYIAHDAFAAIKANPSGHKVGYYADEINYCADELRRRKGK